MTPGRRVSVVVLTHNRAAELARTLERTLALPEHPRIIVVDNASTDGTADCVRARFPGVRLLRLPRNIGAAARNAGIAAAQTPYVACSDDDTTWEPGSLARAERLLDAYPRVGVLSARVLVGRERREDAACSVMAASPLPSAGLPGKRLVGFLAGAAVFRRTAFLEAGGYEPQLFIGAEEKLLAIDLAARGWACVYVDELTVVHEPSAARDVRNRRRLMTRNAIWIAWLRLPILDAVRQTLRAIASSGMPLAAVRDALGGAPWIARRRTVAPRHVAAMLRSVEPFERQPPPAPPGKPAVRSCS